MTLYKHVTGEGKVPMSAQEEIDHFASLVPAPASTDPNDYTHTRRAFKTLLTDAMEAEIKGLVQGIPNAEVKREVRIWWEETDVFRWDDATMIKLIAAVTPATAAAIEVAWLT